MTIKRVNRSVSLEARLSNRLKYLAERLGSNPNSYIVNAIGRAVAADERLCGIHPDDYLNEDYSQDDNLDDLS